MLCTIVPAMQSEGLIGRGSKTFGLHTGYVTLNHSVTAGMEMTYAFSRKFVLAPSFDYVFRNENLDGLLVNIDYQGPWQLDSSGRWYLYHIAGLNYASWSEHAPKAAENGRTDAAADDDVTSRYNRFGLDVGAGIEWYVTPSMRLSAQGKFNWLKNHNTGIFSIGIGYSF